MSDLRSASQPFKRFRRPAARLAALTVWWFAAASALAETTNSAAAPMTVTSLPDAGASLFRICGALFLVLGLFLGGVWLFRNWQRLALQRGRAPKLNVLETRSLGGRHALHVVGYEQERFLITSSPSGVNLLSHLPSPETDEPAKQSGATPAPSFSRALSQIIQGK